jgi:hypothetical protein
MDQHLNLFLDLKPGELADLEVVARASLSFAAAVREIAYIVDPSIVVHLELESGTEGSLTLNSIIRFIRQRIQDPVTRAAIIGAVVAWFAKEALSGLIGVFVADIVTDEQQLTDEQANVIAKKIEEIIEKKIGQKPVQDVFREIQKDKSITGIGVSTKKGDRPRSIIPHSEFMDRTGDLDKDESADESRVRSETMLLTVISPVLQANHNKWRFLSKDGIIYAPIIDDEFLNKLLTGSISIPMKSGIIFVAEVEIKEEKLENVWKISERTVTKIIEFRADDDISDLFSKVEK